MEALREIEELVAFEGRGPGTEVERNAAGHLAERLRSLGREVEIEQAGVHPNVAATHAIHALLVIVGAVVAIEFSAIGLLIVLVATISTFGDLTGQFLLLRRLTGRRPTQNVVSPERGDKVGRIILMAHYDAAPGGAVFSRALSERRATLSRTLRRPIGLPGVFFGAMLVVLVCTLVRVGGIESMLLSLVEFIPLIVLIASVPLLVDVALNRPVPGANDNASGVATVLRLADRFGGELENFDLWVLLPGAQEAQAAGSRAWIKAHRDTLDPKTTIFLNVDEVGYGTIRYLTKEGPLIAPPYHPTLVGHAAAIAEQDEEEGRFHARGIVSRSTSDAYSARARNLPAISISCRGALDYTPHHHQHTDTVERIDGEALDRAFEFLSLMIERIDAQVGAEIASNKEKDYLVQEDAG